MFLSVFDMFKVGVGPSSSHTMGPMVAAARFLDTDAPVAVRVSWPAGVTARIAGLHRRRACDRPRNNSWSGRVRARNIRRRQKPTLYLIAIKQTGMIEAEGLPPLRFNPNTDLVFDYETTLPGHANGMVLRATDAQGDVTLQRGTYYSIGGGFVMTEAELAAGNDTRSDGPPIPYPFKSAAQMLEMAQASGKSCRANETGQ